MPDYVKNMARMQDEDLLGIVHPEARTEYETEAIEAAQSELDRRGLSETDMQRINLKVEQERLAEVERPLAELSNAQMAAFLLFGPILIVSVPLAIMLGAQGYPHKARGAFGAILLSFPLYCLITGMIVFLAWCMGG